MQDTEARIEARISALEENLRSLGQEYKSDKRVLRVTVIVAAALLALFFGVTYERLSDRVSAAIEKSLIDAVEKAEKQAATAAANAEQHAQQARTGVLAIEQAKSQLKAGEFDGDVLIKGSVSVQGKIFPRGGFSTGECELVDGLNKGDYLQCKDGFYVAGARNSTVSASTLDQILCCRSQ